MLEAVATGDIDPQSLIDRIEAGWTLQQQDQFSLDFVAALGQRAADPDLLDDGTNTRTAIRTYCRDLANKLREVGYMAESAATYVKNATRFAKLLRENGYSAGSTKRKKSPYSAYGLDEILNLESDDPDTVIPEDDTEDSLPGILA